LSQTKTEKHTIGWQKTHKWTALVLENQQFCNARSVRSPALDEDEISAVYFL